ncbi:hypothetical protein Tco_1084235, partial [Tanacetum coccineum]
ALASGASAIKERVISLNMDDDSFFNVAVDDDDYGNSHVHKILDKVRPKKKSKDLSCYHG